MPKKKFKIISASRPGLVLDINFKQVHKVKSHETICLSLVYTKNL
jgi:hypothetical protein